MYTDHIGSKPHEDGEGNRCDGTVKVSSFVSGPELSLDVKVRGVKCEGDRGCVRVGAERDSFGKKTYAARLSPAAPKPATRVSQDARSGFEGVVVIFRAAEHAL
jgi:hypothetical protein